MPFLLGEFPLSAGLHAILEATPFFQGPFLLIASTDGWRGGALLFYDPGLLSGCIPKILSG